jgi:hypothetical protein
MNPMGSLASVKDESFSSLEGRYTINLPKQVGGFREGTFDWRLTEGYFSVGYQDRERDVEGAPDAEAETLKQSQAALSAFARNLLEGMVQPREVTHKKIMLAGHAGIESRVEMPKGVAVVRSYPVKRRIYTLIFMLVGAQRQFEPLALKAFDSFKVQAEEDANAVLNRRVAEATPKPLPQEPVARKLKSDAEDENLRGRVKTVLEEMEGLSGRMANQVRRPSHEAHYNEQGNLVKSVLYSSAGLPSNITVYGYIDGARVSSSGSIRYESSPAGIAVPAAKERPRDPRYDLKYEYKYDDKGRLSEQLLYGNDGRLNSRRVYKREGARLEELNYYDEEGRPGMRSLAMLDASGNESEQIYFDSPLKGWQSKYTHTYEFDARGNWVKRTTTKTSIVNGVSKEDSTYITYRTITYY